MMPKRKLLQLVVISLTLSASAQAPAPTPTPPGPTTRPYQPPKADDLLKQLLKPTTRQANPSLEPLAVPPAIDQSSQRAIAPRSQSLSVLREGSYIFDRIGRLARTNDGQAEFIFEADGQAMQDPPLLVHPNLKLTMMENAVKQNTGRTPRFRITGMLTEYGSRNYILIEKFAVVPELPDKPLTK